jgi:hypothetical protein
MQPQQSPRLRRSEASAYLRATWGIERKPSTLARYACEGIGPKFEYVGRIPTYTPAALDTYAQSILSPPCSSTADKPNRDREIEDRGASSTESAAR